MGNKGSSPKGKDRDAEEESQGGKTEATTKKPAKKNFIVQIQEGYAALCNAIIRPPRAEYDMRELGPKFFQISNSRFQRTDFQLVNPRGFTLQCSHWKPCTTSASKSSDASDSQKLPCVVYMHGNSSCRVEAIEYVETILSIGATILAFDFSGCGLSEGPYISLGWYEQEDVHTVITWLRNSNKVSTIGLWGRSMGASTALMFGHRDPSIAAMVLDSPFSDLSVLCRELAGKINVPVPGFLVGGVLGLMRSTIKSKADFDIYNCKPIENVDKCFIPAIFTAGEEDDFILPSHAQDLHEKYAGDKNFVQVPGNHNSQRPRFFKDSVAIFLYARLCEPAGVKSNINNMHKAQIGRQHQDRSQANGQDIVNADHGLMPQYNIPANRATDIGRVGDAVDEDLQKALMMSLYDSKGDNKQDGQVKEMSTNNVDETKEREDMQVQHLVGMGFDREQSRAALRRYKDVNRAAEALIVAASSDAKQGSNEGGEKPSSTEEMSDSTPKKQSMPGEAASTGSTADVLKTPGDTGDSK